MILITSDSLSDVLKTPILDFNPEKVAQLEDMIRSAQASAWDGSPQVDDAVYDEMIRILEKVSPSSEILQTLWDSAQIDTEPVLPTSADQQQEYAQSHEYNRLLRQYPMQSIQTVKSWEDKHLTEFAQQVSQVAPADEVVLHLSYKLNGHAIRVVYDAGRLVYATSRGRAGSGFKVRTRALQRILGEYNSRLAGFGTVEVRGELVLPVSSFQDAQKFGKYTSPFSAVAGLVRDSAPNEAYDLLHFVAYHALADGLDFVSKTNEYEFLSGVGFQVPRSRRVAAPTASEFGFLSAVQSEFAVLEHAMQDEGSEDFYDYFCDGVVCEVEDRALFHALGVSGVRHIGNVALKVGFWQQDVYSGVVQGVIFKPGKSKLSPVVVVSARGGDIEIQQSSQGYRVVDRVDSAGVVTAQGNFVRHVPVYEPRNIILLDSYPGQTIHFRYGGEAGVVPCFPDGRLLSEDMLVDLVSDS